MPDVRKAKSSDIPELVRLRGLLFAELADDFGPIPSNEDWQDACAAALKEQLADDAMRIVVTDGDTGLAACGIGAIDRRIPSPYNLAGRVGYIFNVVTTPTHRRHGHARAIMQALLTWFDTHGLTRVDLHATTEGRPLYYSLGFTTHPEPTLSRKPPPPPTT